MSPNVSSSETSGSKDAVVDGGGDDGATVGVGVGSVGSRSGGVGACPMTSRSAGGIGTAGGVVRGGCPAVIPAGSSSSTLHDGGGERSLADAIVEASFDAMFLSDEKGVVTYVNETAVAATGFTKSELVGQNVSALIGDPRHARLHDFYMKRYLRTGESKIIGKTREGQKLLAKRKDGTVFPAELGLAEIRTSDASAEGGERIQFVGFARDISARKKAEAELRRGRALSEAIIEACVDAMFVVDGGGAIEIANSAAAEQFRCRHKEELVGRNVDSLVFEERRRSSLKNGAKGGGGNYKVGGSDNGGRSGSFFERCIEEESGGQRIECRARRQDGTEFPAAIGFKKVQIKTSSDEEEDEEGDEPWHGIRADDGRPLYCGSVHDLTEHRRVLQLEIERTKAEALLFNMLPEDIADRLRGNPTHIADHHQCVAILFADIVGFTAMSSAMSPVTLVGLLNDLFSSFDALVETYDLNKVKTIGDCYMVTSRPDIEGAHHQRVECSQMCNFGMDMLAVLRAFNDRHPEQPLDLRVGINTGPVVAGVVGTKRFLYDIWGDAVNIASRMESTGVPGRIQVTKDVVDFVGREFVFERRGMVACKGKGDIETYFLERRRDEGKVRKVVGRRRSSVMTWGSCATGESSRNFGEEEDEIFLESLWDDGNKKPLLERSLTDPKAAAEKEQEVLRRSLSRMLDTKEYLDAKIKGIKHRLSVGNDDSDSSGSGSSSGSDATDEWLYADAKEEQSSSVHRKGLDDSANKATYENAEEKQPSSVRRRDFDDSRADLVFAMNMGGEKADDDAGDAKEEGNGGGKAVGGRDFDDSRADLVFAMNTRGEDAEEAAEEDAEEEGKGGAATADDAERGNTDDHGGANGTEVNGNGEDSCGYWDWDGGGGGDDDDGGSSPAEERIANAQAEATGEIDEEDGGENDVVANDDEAEEGGEAGSDNDEGDGGSEGDGDGCWDALAPLHVEKLVDHSADEFSCRILTPSPVPEDEAAERRRTFTVRQDREARRRPAAYGALARDDGDGRRAEGEGGGRGDENGSASAVPRRDLTERDSLTGAVAWDGAVVLAGMLGRAAAAAAAEASASDSKNNNNDCDDPLDPGGKRVVELGCGLAALPGVAAAALGASSVALTDLSAVVGGADESGGDADATDDGERKGGALLRRNVNRNLTAEERSRVSVEEHEWKRIGQGVILPSCMDRADLVLAADTIYDVDLVEPFVSSLKTVLNAGRPGATAVCVFDESIGRHAAYRAFEALVRETFETVEELNGDGGDGSRAWRDDELDSDSVRAFLIREPLPGT